ncbi:PREDICTED: endoplasmic reticulum-Golgi intermediate compartment protein 1-like [Priapulus caudatus]|uniref:Endoplasmic reticulum-Golgi intermediate compartment protein 1-like n=1 Tax=Priapulus caudatus TaxID=37621 RepID=A0ABM1EHN6_PRICU|nr:PREDICTED: endoplasmic reticulum-Golgi intermediate compartment protein 1-like [Priapulus caudatus]
MAIDVRRFDIYRKIPKDLTQATLTGGYISVCCVLFIAFLFVSELYFFLKADVQSELFVDNTDVNEKIKVRLNITLPNLNCEVLGLDIQDDGGRHEVGFMENIFKTPLMTDGRVGCNFQAKFQINKVPGNFHISTHAAGHQTGIPDMSHYIHELSYGDKIMESHVPGNYNPLRDADKTEGTAMATHEYIMRIVPAIYEDIHGNKKSAYQFSYAYKQYVQYGHGHVMVPAIWFRYDLNPITVKYLERRPPIYSFLTTVCAIIGGTFTVAGIIDSCIFTAAELFKKAEMGKLS